MDIRLQLDVLALTAQNSSGLSPPRAPLSSHPARLSAVRVCFLSRVCVCFFFRVCVFCVLCVHDEPVAKKEAR